MRRKSKKNIKLLAIPLLLIIGAVILMEDTDSIFSTFTTNEFGTISDGFFSQTPVFYTLEFDNICGDGYVFEATESNPNSGKCVKLESNTGFTGSTNHLMTCENVSRLALGLEKTSSSGAVTIVWDTVDSRADFFNTEVLADITNEDFEKVGKLRVQNYVSCDYIDTDLINKLTIEGGIATYRAFTGSISEKLLQSNNIPLKVGTVIPDNNDFASSSKYVLVSQVIYDADEIEPKLTVSSGGNAWFEVDTVISAIYVLDLAGTDDQKSAEQGGQTSSVRTALSVVDDPNPRDDQTIVKNALIRIEEVKQVKTGDIVISSTIRTGTLDTGDVLIGGDVKSKGQQIKITAIMRDYSELEGYPLLTLTFNNKQISTNLKYTGNEVDGTTGIFSNNFLIPTDYEGTVNLKLTHPLRNTESNVSFTVIDLDIDVEGEPIVNGGCAEDETRDPISGSCIPKVKNIDFADGNPTVLNYFKYSHDFTGVLDCQVTDSGTVDTTRDCDTTKTVTGVVGDNTVQLKMANLIDRLDIRGDLVDAKLSEVEITMFVTAELETLSVLEESLSSTMNYEAKLIVDENGEKQMPVPVVINHTPSRNLCANPSDDVKDRCDISKINLSTEHFLGQIGVDVITINANTLNNVLKSNSIEADGKQVLLQITAVDGTYILRDVNNQNWLTSAIGTEYNYVFNYGAEKLNPDDDAESIVDSCVSNDPKVGCECEAEDQTLGLDIDTGEPICVDIDTGEPTGDKPKSNPSKINPSPVDSCVIEPNGNIVAYGNISITECEQLIKDANPNNNNDDPPIIVDDDDPPKGNGTEQPLIDCETIFGDSFCARADSGELFNTPVIIGGEDSELDFTLIGIILAILVVLIAVVMAMKKRKPKLYARY